MQLLYYASYFILFTLTEKQTHQLYTMEYLVLTCTDNYVRQNDTPNKLDTRHFKIKPSHFTVIRHT